MTQPGRASRSSWSSRWSTRTTCCCTRRRTRAGAMTRPGWRARSASRPRWTRTCSTKPSVQAEFLRIFNLTGAIPTPQMKRNYLNFYGNLMKASDEYLVKILDTLESRGLLENTLVVATADHGEMGTAHGGLRQKNFNFYEETTRIPLVYSNPRLFPRPERNRSLVSHVRLPAHPGRSPRRAGARPGQLAGGRLLRPGPVPVSPATPGLHRLYLRRLAVRAGHRPLPEAAEPHRQHPRAPLQDRPVLRRQREGAAPVGDV